jgi:polygalacturonase
MKFIFRVTILLLFIAPAITSGQDFNIMDFGAVPDGRTLNSRAIQSAIDAAHSKGGGRVIVPGGKFLTGALVVKSGVEIMLEKKAVLLGSTKPDDYFKLNRWLALIMADGQERISITGQGVIDGQGRALALHIDSLFYAGLIDSAHYNFVEMRPMHYIRPQLIEFVGCKDIKIVGVTFMNAACWVQTYDQCRDIVIEDIRVESDAYWNNDGIDIQDCTNVRISDCFVNAADDGICLKSQSRDYLCDGIIIERCTVRSSASAVKFGTVSHGGFKNVTIRDIKVYDTFRSAIAIECVDGGILENVLVENIEAKNTGNAIFIRLGKRNKTGPPGILRNVTIRNLKAEIAFERPDYAYDIRGPELPFFHNTFPASITGIPGAMVENITLQDIEIIYPGRGNPGLANLPVTALDRVPEKESAYPEFSMFGELPAWGFYVRHVRGLKMKSVKVTAEHADYRPALVLDDVLDSSLQQIEINGDQKAYPVIIARSPQIQVNANVPHRQL